MRSVVAEKTTVTDAKLLHVHSVSLFSRNR
jgi:hypothetical protein